MRPHHLSAAGSTPVDGLSKGAEFFKHGCIEPYRLPLLCDAGEVHVFIAVTRHVLLKVEAVAAVVVAHGWCMRDVC